MFYIPTYKMTFSSLVAAVSQIKCSNSSLFHPVSLAFLLFWITEGPGRFCFASCALCVFIFLYTAYKYTGKFKLTSTVIYCWTRTDSILLYPLKKCVLLSQTCLLSKGSVVLSSLVACVMLADTQNFIF